MVWMNINRVDESETPIIEMIEIEEVDLAIIKLRGEITYSHLVERTMEATKNGQFRLRNYQITDFRNTNFTLTHKEIYEFLKLLKADQNYTRALRTVYIVNDSKSTALAYILSQSFNGHIEESVFSTVEGALTSMDLMPIKDIVHLYIDEDDL